MYPYWGSSMLLLPERKFTSSISPFQKAVQKGMINSLTNMFYMVGQLFMIYDLFMRLSYHNGSLEVLKICTMLHLFKGKGLKAYDKDNYRGFALFPAMTLKIFEMILLKRLEDFARIKSYFCLFSLG